MTLERKIRHIEDLRGFRIVRHLGQGGMGSVFKAVYPNGCHVAVKIFHPEVISSLDRNENIFSDWHKAARVQHPNLCRLLELYSDQEIVFLIMEYIQGKSLRSIVKSRSHCPVENGLELSISTMCGVSALHKVKLIHGDVRPVNICVVDNSSVKLIDYGVSYPKALCQADMESTNRTYTGYMPPEIWQGNKPNLLSDVYSLGVLTYHLLTGEKPRKRPDQKEVKPLRFFQKSVRADIEELVLKALSLEPEIRPKSAMEMLSGLGQN